MADKQEQPDHINEVPVPVRGFEAKVLFDREMTGQCTEQTNGQEDGADDHVESMEAGGHEECRTIDVAVECEGSVGIFIGLTDGEDHTKQNRQRKAPLQTFAGHHAGVRGAPR